MTPEGQPGSILATDVAEMQDRLLPTDMPAHFPDPGVTEAKGKPGRHLFMPT